MTTRRKILIGALVVILAIIGLAAYLFTPDRAQVPLAALTGAKPELTEPRAESFPTVGIAEPVGWRANEVPVAAQGLAVTRFADGLDHPRTMLVLPNGDVLVALTNRPPSEGSGGLQGMVEKFLFRKAGAGEPSADQIALLRDTDGDGKAEQRAILSNAALASPSGMAWADGTLYVANHNAVLAFPYDLGATTLDAKPVKLMDLPAAGNHWMRNLVISPDGTDLYIAVGSASNIAEKGIEREEGRAAIWNYNLETKRQRVFARGLRNPNGLDFSPWSGELWTTVNERDMLGSDLVPDYLTNVPIGADYGWPWVWWRHNFDERVTAFQPAGFNPDYVRIPEYALGPHVAALGLAFTGSGSTLGDRFDSGAVIARHGSWNRSPKSGYDVIYVPFDARGNPVGKPVPVLTGFLSKDGKTTRGRPTWVAFAQDGALLVTDDTAGIVWRVTAPGAAPAPAIERVSGERLPPQRELRGQEASFGADFARETPE
ncbi:sorbosone dehydrogenase family protein [Altererythrobacter sp. TH136]|uniref:PQQ-dependent sugar dehydrogenase n=1 Tax=Altererythrobacter sp. TH136 TaxID=2067415 RepID=UPI0011633795|nr:sorbosone dehydrogenase family protein [Altererythrobacter sp. TH136]QDM41061.1 sorbosone dehydrogenase family protein [Altererythrobacter sp. TH136]